MNFPTEKETTLYFLDLLSRNRLQNIIDKHCKVSGVPRDILLGRSRKQEHVTIRYKIVIEADEKGFEPSTIARSLNRDRTTILNYLSDDYTPPNSLTQS